jgi:hypothetical protein
MTDSTDKTENKTEDTSKLEDNTTDTSKTSSVDLNDPAIQEAIRKAAEEAIAPLKGKLDAAYSTRDEALAKLKEKEAKERQAELDKLTADGKHEEVFNAKLAEKEAELENLRKRNVELSRDVTVRESLKSFQFRNDLAADMAYKLVVEQLVQGADGVWVHKSGVSIRDFVTSFAQGEEQSFLFKPKANSGGGTTQTPGKTPDTTKGKSLFELTQQEVLAKAAAGEFGNRTF